MLRLVRETSGAAPASRDWSHGELAECWRFAEILRRHGLPVELDHGLSDEGDPWLVFVLPGRDEPLAHAARIDGRVHVIAPGLGLRYDGFTLREALRRCAEDERFRALMAPLRVVTDARGVLMHPFAVLAALLALSLVAAKDAEAADEATRLWHVWVSGGGDSGPDTSADAPTPRAEPAKTVVPADLALWRDTGRRAVETNGWSMAGIAAALLVLAPLWREGDSLTPTPLTPESASPSVARSAAMAEDANTALGAVLDPLAERPRGHAPSAETAREPAAVADTDTPDHIPPRRESELASAPEGNDTGVSAPEGVAAADPRERGMPTPPSLAEANEPGAGAGTPVFFPLIAVAPLEPLLSSEVARSLEEAIAAREQTLAATAVPAAYAAMLAFRDDGAAGLAPPRWDFAARDAEVFAQAVEGFATWIVDRHNEVVLAADRKAGVKLLMETAFAGGSAVSKVVLVEDGPGTIQPYRLTHDIGLLSVDYVPGAGTAEAMPVVLGLPALGDVMAVGWLSV